MKKAFRDYRIRLNLRTMCMYEAMTGKSFFDFDDKDAEEMLKVIYCSLMASNDLRMTYTTFISLMGDNEVSKWLLKEFEKISIYNQQFAAKDDAHKSVEGKSEKERLKARDIAGFLIVRCGMDADYVYDRMPLYEVEDYMRAFEAEEKDILERERLWTYISISPQIDGKKIKGPEDIIKFPWDKETKANELDKNKDLIRKILGGKKKDGRNDALSQSGGLSEYREHIEEPKHNRQEQNNTGWTEGGSKSDNHTGEDKPAITQPSKERQS